MTAIPLLILVSLIIAIIYLISKQVLSGKSISMNHQGRYLDQQRPAYMNKMNETAEEEEERTKEEEERVKEELKARRKRTRKEKDMFINDNDDFEI